MKNTAIKIIKLSKLKLALMFIGSWTFVTAGVFFVTDPTRFNSIWMRSHEELFAIGVAGILFFGITGIFLGRKLFDPMPGLILTNEGFYDNSSAVSAGFVKWDDVKGIETYKVVKTKMIFIHLKNPEDYINCQPNKFKKMLMKLNLKKYGTPLTLSSNGLQCDFQELFNLVQNKVSENDED